MIDEMNILIAGVGGQGALTLAGVMADAAIKSDINVISGEVHGMAQRGGAVFVHVRMGGKVRGPIIPLGQANVIIGLEMVEPLRYLDFLSENGSIVVSKTPIVPPLVWAGLAVYPDEQTVFDQYKKITDSVCLIDSLGLANRTGNPLTANIVLLGAMAACVDMPFEKQVMLDSLASIMPERIRDINIHAFELGWQEARGKALR